MKHIRILRGPYHGQTLSLDDDVAAAAIADEWGADTSAEGYDRFNEPPAALGDAADYPASLQGWLDDLAGIPPDQRQAAKAKPAKAAKPADDQAAPPKAAPAPADDRKAESASASRKPPVAPPAGKAAGKAGKRK